MTSRRDQQGTTVPTRPERRPVRDRLLSAADELFYEEGVNTVGIDRVIERAGVAKASLYTTFGSKDALVAAYLAERQASRKQRIEGAIAGLKTPRARLLGVFDAMAQAFAMPNFRGCAFLRASAEMRDDSGATAVLEEARGWLRELLERLAREAGAHDPSRLARQLVLLYDGALAAAQLDHDADAARFARDAAERLLDAALAVPPKGRRVA